jgi:cell division protein FtsQ
LPENGIDTALETLVQLDRDKKLLSRDLEVVDLRLADRVTVRLSEHAFAARAEALKPPKPKRKGNDA